MLTRKIQCAGEDHRHVRYLGTTALAALVLMLGTPEQAARAQTAGADADRRLPPVTVQPDERPAARQQPSGTTSRAAKRRSSRAARTAAQTVQGGANSVGADAKSRDADGYIARATGVGSKSDTPILQLPRSVSTIKAQEISDRGAASVQEALQYTAGVQTSFRPGNLGREYTLIRGFLAFQYLDGLKQHDSSWAFEPYGLERIDVLKGPASSLYGQGSPGGLWDMTSKRPTDQAFGEILMQAGSYGKVLGAFDVGGPVNADHSLLYRVVGLGKIGDGQINFTENERLFIAPSFTWRPSENTSFTVLASYQKDPHQTVLQPLPYVGTVVPGTNGQYISRNLFLGEPAYHNTSIETSRIGYEFKHQFNDVFSFQQNLGYQRINVNLQEVQSRAIGVGTSVVRQMVNQQYNIDIFQIDNRLKADFDIGPLRHHMMFGIDYADIPNFQGTGQNRATQYLLNLYNPVYGQALAAANPITSFRYQQQTQVGIYAQDRVELGKWSVLFGTRYDQADLAQQTRTLNLNTNVLGNPVSIRQSDHAQTSHAGVIYNFDNGLAPYASFSQSFYPSSGADFFNKPFIPTTGHQVEAGVKYLPPGLDLLVTAAVFDITQNNVLTPDVQHPGFAVQTSSNRNKGVEFEVKTTRQFGFNMSAAYTYIDPKVIATNVVGVLGKMPTGVSPQTASLWATYRFTGSTFEGLTLGGGVRYVGLSAADALNTAAVPAFTLFDLSANYQLGAVLPTLTNWDVSFNIRNLMDKQYVASCDDTTQCYYGLGRTFNGTVRARF